MQIDAMTFKEFLPANGGKNLVSFPESVDTMEPVPDAFFHPLYEKPKMDYVTGGMPEPVLMWAKARTYKDAFQWPVDARLVHKAFRSTAPALQTAPCDDLSAFMSLYLIGMASAAALGMTISFLTLIS